MHGISPIDVFWMEVANEGNTLLTKRALLKNPPLFLTHLAQFHRSINPISAPQTGLW